MEVNPKPMTLREYIEQQQRGHYGLNEKQELNSLQRKDFLRRQAAQQSEPLDQKIARLEKRLDEIEYEMKDTIGWRKQLLMDEFVALYRELRTAKGIPDDGIRFNEVLK